MAFNFGNALKQAALPFGMGAVMDNFMGGSGGGGGFDRGLYNDMVNVYSGRQKEIADFERALGSARSRYLASLNDLNTLAYSEFSGDTAAKFGSRGLQVSGGAFQSALAKEAARLKAGMLPSIYEAEGRDAAMIDSARAGAFNSRIGFTGQQSMLEQNFAENRRMMDEQNEQRLWEGLGGFATQAGLMALNPALGMGYSAMSSMPSRSRSMGSLNLSGYSNGTYGSSMPSFGSGNYFNPGRNRLARPGLGISY